MQEMERNDRGSPVLADLVAPVAVEVLIEADTTDWMARCPTLAYVGTSKGLLGLFSRRVSDLKDTECTTLTD